MKKIFQKLLKRLEKINVFVLVLVVLVLIGFLVFIAYNKGLFEDPPEEVIEIDTKEKVDKLEELIKERRGGEEYVAPTEEEVELQTDRLQEAIEEAREEGN